MNRAAGNCRASASRRRPCSGRSPRAHFPPLGRMFRASPPSEKLRGPLRCAHPDGARRACPNTSRRRAIVSDEARSDGDGLRRGARAAGLKEAAHGLGHEHGRLPRTCAGSRAGCPRSERSGRAPETREYSKCSKGVGAGRTPSHVRPGHTIQQTRFLQSFGRLKTIRKSSRSRAAFRAGGLADQRSGAAGSSAAHGRNGAWRAPTIRDHRASARGLEVVVRAVELGFRGHAKPHRRKGPTRRTRAFVAM